MSPTDCKSSGGLQNQGWKDSGDCIVDAGWPHRRQGPIALSEVQGYIYAAKMRLAPLAELQDRPDLRDRWHHDAATLKTRFEQDFWLADEGYFALALDGNGEPVDSITSNPGHCLGLGIFTPEKGRERSRSAPWLRICSTAGAFVPSAVRFPRLQPHGLPHWLHLAPRQCPDCGGVALTGESRRCRPLEIATRACST
jgi:hypothetical protein